jgi:hypothetical protein
VDEKSKKNLGIHAGLILGETICILAFYVEFRRATGGNTLSWAYVVEWPIFALYIIYMWRRLLREENTPAPSFDGPGEVPDEPDEPALVAMNNYFRAVHGLSESDERLPVNEKPHDRVT